MDRTAILNFLLDSELEGVEEVEYEGALVVKCYYDFDQAELDAAKAGASDETDFEEESTDWITQGVIPYLDDIAQDIVEEIIEDVVNEFDAGAEIVSVDIDPANYTYKAFLVALAPEDEDINIDQILLDLNV